MRVGHNLAYNGKFVRPAPNVARSPALSARTAVKMMDGEPKRFALDLSKTHLVDSGGLAAMIALLRAVRDVGGDVRVIAANASVRRVFEVTALSRVFKYHPIRPQVVSAA